MKNRYSPFGLRIISMLQLPPCSEVCTDFRDHMVTRRSLTSDRHLRSVRQQLNVSSADVTSSSGSARRESGSNRPSEREAPPYLEVHLGQESGHLLRGFYLSHRNVSRTEYRRRRCPRSSRRPRVA